MPKPKKKLPKKVTVYHWFQGASVVELVRRLNAAGPSTARLEVYQKGKQMTFIVKSEGVTTLEDDPPVNESHLCPPQC